MVAASRRDLYTFVPFRVDVFLRNRAKAGWHGPHTYSGPLSHCECHCHCDVPVGPAHVRTTVLTSIPPRQARSCSGRGAGFGNESSSLIVVACLPAHLCCHP